MRHIGSAHTQTQTHRGTQLHAHSCLTRGTPTSRHKHLWTYQQAHAHPLPQVLICSDLKGTHHLCLEQKRHQVLRSKETRMYSEPRKSDEHRQTHTRAHFHRGTHVCSELQSCMCGLRAPHLDVDSQVSACLDTSTRAQVHKGAYAACLQPTKAVACAQSCTSMHTQTH